MELTQALKIINERFRYRADEASKLDHWTILDPDAELVEGDCEDYALTVMWLLSDRSVFKFALDTLLMKHRLYVTISPTGGAHAVGSYGGQFYDNILRHKTTKSEMMALGYTFKSVVLPPVIWLKILIGWYKQ